MFAESLQTKINQTSPIAVGIDLDIRLMPTEWLQQFAKLSYPTHLDYLVMVYRKYGRLIIEAVAGQIPAIKIQIAFFEPLGWQGIKVMEELLLFAKKEGLLVIMDAKRGDVPSTAQQYAEAYLGKGVLESDALTLNPYLGLDSLEPFLELAEKFKKGVFICLKTSNPGSGDLQNVSIYDKESPDSPTPLYLHLAKLFLSAEDRLGSNLGVVVGATYPEEAKTVRQVLKKAFFLVPGLGAQGGDIEAAKYYFNQDGRAIFNFSRRVIYPDLDGSSKKWKEDKAENKLDLLLKQQIQERLEGYIEKLSSLTP